MLYEESLSYVDTSKGAMKSIKAVLQAEGVEDTTKYVKQCAEMGPPWIEWDPMWERYNVMVMEKSHSEIFTKAWRLKEQRKDGNAPPAEGALPAEAGLPAPGSQRATGKAKGKGTKPEAAPKAGSKRVGVNEIETPDKKKVVTPLAQANRSKTNYKAAVPGVQTLQAVIPPSTAWSWAANEATQKPMQNAKEMLDKAVSASAFAQLFLSMPVGEVKKTHSEEQITNECGALVTLLDPLVRGLIHQTSQLVNMHASRSKAAGN